jgi:hypothetical protein
MFKPCDTMTPERRLTRENQAPFGIRVVDFDSLPTHGVDAAYQPNPLMLFFFGKKRKTHMSPGLVALGPGIFSQRGVTVTTLTLHVVHGQLSRTKDTVQRGSTHGS